MDDHRTDNDHRDLFDDEEQTVTWARELLRDESLDSAGLRASFQTLLDKYLKLYRQSVRLNRINDRSQLAQRRTEQMLSDTLAELRVHQEKLAFDQGMVEEILAKLHATTTFDGEGLRHLLIPLDRTSGDLLLSRRRPDDVRHILLGDITGHGLPAAIIAPEVSDVFHAMTGKGFAPGVILAEINQRLKRRLPIGIYMAAAMLEFDEASRQLFVWNGGLPEGLLFRGGEVVARMPSGGFPLGIVGNRTQRWARAAYALEPGDRVLFHSDGIIEGKNEHGELFGQERLERHVRDMHAGNAPLETIVEAMKTFVGGDDGINDDISMVEVTG